MLKVAGSCGKFKKLRKVAGNGKSCGTATTATKLCPWSSDACEQLFAFLRTGRYCGRRTNLDALTVLQGMSKKNRTLTLDEEGEHMLEHTIAHTRGRTLLSGQEKAPHVPIYTKVVTSL